MEHWKARDRDFLCAPLSQHVYTLKQSHNLVFRWGAEMTFIQFLVADIAFLHLYSLHAGGHCISHVWHKLYKVNSSREFSARIKVQIEVQGSSLK